MQSESFVFATLVCTWPFWDPSLVADSVLEFSLVLVAKCEPRAHESLEPLSASVSQKVGVENPDFSSICKIFNFTSLWYLPHIHIIWSHVCYIYNLKKELKWLSMWCRKHISSPTCCIVWSWFIMLACPGVFVCAPFLCGTVYTHYGLLGIIFTFFHV